MKYIVTLDGRKMIFTDAQLTTLIDLLDEVPILTEEYIGTGKGDDGGAYKLHIRRLKVESDLTVRTMSENRFQALLLKTKLYDESK